MPSPDAAARHTGAGVARRQAHHERMRDERAREAAAGDAELPPEDDAVEMASAVHVLDSVAEVGPNYTLLRSKETKAKRRKRKREDARAALDGHSVLSTGSRLEIFCDSERWYPATVMAREEDADGRIVHTRSSTTATRIGGGGTCWTTSGGAPSQSRPARAQAALPQTGMGMRRWTARTASRAPVPWATPRRPRCGRRRLPRAGVCGAARWRTSSRRRMTSGRTRLRVAMSSRC